MAAGQVVLGHPWYGVWLSCGAMMASLVWAMQGWLPPRWALLGGVTALPLAIVSYWMNSYWGGAIAAIGGALLLGGYARVVKRRQAVYAIAMGIGIALLANSRPYEGLVFSIPVAIAFLWSRPRWQAVAPLAAVLLPAFAATGHYNRAVTGSALNMPFTEYARQYAYIPLFNYQPLQASKSYPTRVLFDLHQNWERTEWEKARSWELIPIRLRDWKGAASTIFGHWAPVLLVLIFAAQIVRDRRVRLPLMCIAAVLAGSMIEVRYYPHYAGPATVAALILAVQALRHLRLWKPPAGRVLAWAFPLLVVGVAMAPQAWKIVEQPVPSGPKNGLRDRVAESLREQGGKHVILVHYTGWQSPHEEWVYNSADIDSQDVIWADDLGSEENAALVEYYKDRKIWRFQPDIDSLLLEPYK
jgi:hypothetical protein